MKYLQFLSLILLILSCNSPVKEKSSNESELQMVADSIPLSTPAYNPETNLFVWKVDYNYTKMKNQSLNNTILVADSLIKGLNQKYENIYVEKINQGHDTLYTTIKDSEFLSQQMGSTGAETYLADVILNLTEIPGIRYINIDLKPGDHMEPGTWSKENFEKYKTVK